MTLQELLAESLERLGAAGIAPVASTTEDKLFRSIEDLRAPLGDHSYYVLRANQRVVWASADGTLFPSAEERDAYERNRPGSPSAYDGANQKRRDFDEQCDVLECRNCRLRDDPMGTRAGCFRAWLSHPGSMPLDKRIPWPKQT